ncbi:AraC family transcriptional regulator [Shewanella gelidimarina]|uniref:helix-turn-helix domain-containing protein n=1 Tax=Shewanella gelidimarina TaxID=56813 RepID=UPI00200E7BDB|nr:AraC family transcriptional regulator [Shewanella gelidimarina]MCL1058600.1 AraC family transcriptional regulator [Shewanella gelidimarina]
MTNPKYSTIAAWSLAIARALSASNINASAVFSDVGLSLAQLELEPDSRVAIDKMTMLWQAVERTSGSLPFGLTVGQYAYPIHFRSLGALMMSCDTLAQAFETLPDYSALVSNSAVISLQRSPHLLGFTIIPLNGVEISALAIDAFFSSLMLHGKQMIGHSDFVRKVELIRPETNSQQAWLDFFDCPVVMGAVNNCMWMDRAMLEQAVISKDPLLAQHNEKAVRQYLDKMQVLNWQEKTSQGIHALLVNEEPTALKIAQMYNISERSLSRYLHLEGTGFRALLKLKRQELAHHYLINTQMPINTLSDTLGYSSVSNFSRFFHTWKGISPSDYRKRSNC